MNQRDREILDRLQSEITELKDMVERIMIRIGIGEKYKPEPFTPHPLRERKPFEPVFMKERKYYNPWGDLMPYIEPNDRKKYDLAIEKIVDQLNISGITGFYPVGELNYIISTIIKKTLDRQGLRYQTVNAIIGALECCKLELYRRIAIPYEDEKIKLNGDVYDEF